MPDQFPRSLGWFVAGMALCVPALSSVPVRAAGPATAPDSGALDVVVLEVKGTVQASTDDAKTWSPVKAGLHLHEGASFRTGFRSSVSCGIPPDQGFTIESLSTVRVDEAIKSGKKFKTNLVMKYGATNYSIETGGAEHETTIRTPGSTLSVRGTVVRVTDRPGYAPTAESFTGRAVYKTRQGITTVGAKGGKYARVSSGQGDAANTALSQTIVDPAALLARTATDARLIAQQTSLGALVTFDTRADIPVVRNSAPFSDADLLKNLPGTLDFVLRWTGNADLNLIVDDQPVSAKDIARGTELEPRLVPPVSGLSPINLGQIGITRGPMGFQPQELLFPGFGLNVSATGGVIPYDNRGGPKGGMEIAYWNGTQPLGIYGIGVLHASVVPTNYTVNAFLNGSPLNIISFGTAGLVKGPALTGTVNGGTNDVNASGIVFVPGNSYLENQIPLSSATATAVPAIKPARGARHLKSPPASFPPPISASRAAPMRAR